MKWRTQTSRCTPRSEWTWGSDSEESEADDFITELFVYLGEQPGQLSQLAQARPIGQALRVALLRLCTSQEWDRVNVNAISDLHRVKTKGA